MNVVCITVNNIGDMASCNITLYRVSRHFSWESAWTTCTE